MLTGRIFGIGWLIDLFILPMQVTKYNQRLDLEKKIAQIAKIVETDKSQEDLFVAAKTVIEYTDKEAGILRGNGTISHFKFKIDVKNNRAKIELIVNEAITQSLWDKRIKSNFETIVTDFEQNISAKNDTF